MNIGRNSPVITNLHTQKSPAIHDCLSTVDKVFSTLLKLLENPLSPPLVYQSLPRAAVGSKGERHKSFVVEVPSQWSGATQSLPL